MYPLGYAPVAAVSLQALRPNTVRAWLETCWPGFPVCWWTERQYGTRTLLVPMVWGEVYLHLSVDFDGRVGPALWQTSWVAKCMTPDHATALRRLGGVEAIERVVRQREPDILRRQGLHYRRLQGEDLPEP